MSTRRLKWRRSSSSAAGVAAGVGWLALASAAIAVSTLLLVEKSSLHALVARIDDDELRAAARFGVMAIVILPLLPEGPYGPLGGVKPRELWLLVLFFSGLSFVGYAARRMFGPGRGYPVAGLLAGLVSSTNATFMFARQSRRDAELSRPLAIGTIAACTVLFPRVLVATLVLNAGVAKAVWPYLIPPFAVGLIGVAVLWRTSPEPAPRQSELANPLQFATALQMALTFQVVLFAVTLVRRYFGTGGLLATGALLGLHDVDALTISMSQSSASGVPVAVGGSGDRRRRNGELCRESQHCPRARRQTVSSRGKHRDWRHGHRDRDRVDGRDDAAVAINQSGCCRAAVDARFTSLAPRDRE